jgi:hypothetical protein
LRAEASGVSLSSSGTNQDRASPNGVTADGAQAGPGARTNAAWLGAMADSGFLHAAYLDVQGDRLLMVVTAESVADADQRLADLPLVRSGVMTYRIHPVRAARLA